MAGTNIVRRILDPRQGRVVHEVQTALANRHVVPLRRQVAAWRRGFYADTTRMYDFDRYGFDAYISDFERATTLASMNENRYILDDKVITYLYLHQAGVPTPTVHGFVRDGTIVWLAAEPPEGGVQGLLERCGRLVVKSRSGSGGKSFALMQQVAGATSVNGRVVADPVESIRTGSLVITDFAVQHERIAEIYPNTTNTMRLMTFRDEATGEPFVAFASHRFGTKRSEPVDNFGAGGLSTQIDIGTGELQQAMVQTALGDGRREISWTDEHPDTGARITGTKVPHWAEVLNGVLRAAEVLPGHRYVGWDVVVTADGFSIIEGNNRADVLVQLHSPLLLDERTRRIFAARRR